MSAVSTTAPTRRLVVTGCEPIAQGAGKDGRPGWTLYRVEARDEHGQVVGHALRSFDLLEPGTSDEFQIERRDNDRYGTSYLLKRARGRLGDRVSELELKTAAHDRRITALEDAPPY